MLSVQWRSQAVAEGAAKMGLRGGHQALGAA